jgi:excisionase family DNA binding protein
MVIQNIRTQRRLFRIPQAVDYLGGAVKAATLRQWIWRRRIEYVHIGRAVCIPQDALDRLIDTGTVPALEVQ